MTIRTATLLCALAMMTCFTQNAPAQEPTSPPEHRVEMWLDLYTGEPVEFDEMIRDLAQADLIFLGEHHTVPRHHQWQQKIIETLTSGGASLVLGLEMVGKQYQPELDRYGKGEIDFEELAEATVEFIEMN